MTKISQINKFIRFDENAKILWNTKVIKKKKKNRQSSLFIPVGGMWVERFTVLYFVKKNGVYIQGFD